jgi:hypothetical protein
VKQIRKRLTYANVMSSIAVFLVLGGATAYAATKIGTNEIKGNAITTGKIKKEAVARGKIKKAAIDATRLADGAVTTSKLANDAVTGEKVNEATLGPVPEASKVGGLNTAALVTKTELLWALIDGDTGTASIIRTRGAVAASSPGTGRYVVEFNRNIASCGIVATLGDATTEDAEPGEIAIDQPAGNQVEVETFNSAGAPADTLETNGFYIQVTC